MLVSLAIQAQTTINGTITDVLGNPLSGANVILDNTYKGDQTDMDGRYSIDKVTAGKYTLVVSYVGYDTQRKEVIVSGRTQKLDIKLTESAFVADEVLVSATRAKGNTPTTYTNIDEEDIAVNNLGQDMPYLLDYLTPSMVVTSDAGTGIGYTGMRIRGTDPTRINVTINGIPLNDSESQGVFWVNLPDLASSTSSVQVQRGVGTSTNGAGAFGATVNILTAEMNDDFQVNLNNSIGSFNTRKSTLAVSSGLLNNKFTIDGRLSNIVSDGYIDRASSDLNSAYLSAAYYGDGQSLRFNVLHGHEVTYQAWWGVSNYIIDDNRTFNFAGTEKPGEPYDNQVDDYTQTHLQLLYVNELTNNLTLNGALHYTKGFGFYEEYEAFENPLDYGLIGAGIVAPSVMSTDIVRQRWLDNDFYGLTYSLDYATEKSQTTLGGGYNNYLGDHFGYVIFSDSATTTLDADNPHEYYRNDAVKSDFNIFIKENYQLAEGLNAFADLQFRRVSYSFLGIDDDGSPLNQAVALSFFNPKFGLNYQLNKNTAFYISYGIANKEPNRNDYVDNPPSQRPVHETLYDLEAGTRIALKNAAFNLNFYRMDYDNQLAITGEINDVGAYTRVNIPQSYRMGVELEGGIQLLKALDWRFNATLSQNKIVSYTEFLDSYDADFNWLEQQTISHNNSDLALSPNVIAGSQLTYDLLSLTSKAGNSNKLELAFLSKYVGKQYIDNASSEETALNPYFVSDFRINYGLKATKNIEADFIFMVRNVFDNLYESNAWSYRYYYDGALTADIGYYPQAGRQFMVGLNLTFK